MLRDPFTRVLLMIAALLLGSLTMIVWTVVHAAVFTDCGVPNCQVVQPVLNNASLPTAGQGIVQAGRWNADNWVSQKVRVLSVSKSWESRSQVRELRIEWSMIEPQPGQYAWDDLKKAIDAAWNSEPRKQTILRFIGYNPKTKRVPGAILDAVPGWFQAEAKVRGPKCTGIGSAPDWAGSPKGCTWYEGSYTGVCVTGETCTKLFAFNPNELAPGGFQSRMLSLIASFRSTFDTPEYRQKLFAVDVGLMGTWGELESVNTVLTGTNLNWPMSNATNARAIVDAWWALSDGIQITSNFQFAFEDGTQGTKRRSLPKTGWQYVCGKAAAEAPGGQLAGWRNDGLNKPGLAMSTAWVVDPALAADPVLAKCWTTGSLNGEPMRTWPLTEAFDPDQDLAGALTWWAGLRGTLFNAKFADYSAYDAPRRALFDGWGGRVGYKLHPTMAIFPTSVRASDRWNIVIEIENAGPNPFLFRGYTAQIRLHSLSGNSDILPLTINLNQLVPGQALTGIKTDMSLSTGNWSVDIGIGPAPGIVAITPVYLSLDQSGVIAGADGTRWYSLGYITVN